MPKVTKTRVSEWQRQEVEIFKCWFIFTLLFSFAEKASDSSPVQKKKHGFFCGQTCIHEDQMPESRSHE